MNQVPLINGVRHSWASIKLRVLGRTVTGFTAVMYEDKQNKSNNYGGGVLPVSRGHGNIEPKASIKLHDYEIVAIQKSLPRGERIQDIAPFDITVSYIRKGETEIITDVIQNAEFTNNTRDMKQGDTVIESAMELIISSVKWHQ